MGLCGWHFKKSMSFLALFYLLLFFLERAEGHTDRDREKLKQAPRPTESPLWGLISQP